MNEDSRRFASTENSERPIAGQELDIDFMRQAKAQLDMLEQQMRTLDEKLSALQTERSKKGVMIRHLRGLLNVRNDDDEQGQLDSLDSSSTNGQMNSDADRVVEYLRMRGLPVHYRKIYEDLNQEGIVAGGKDPALTLLARFYRDSRLVRVGRGTYAVRQ